MSLRQSAGKETPLRLQTISLAVCVCACWNAACARNSDSGDHASESPPRPNVIMILVDTLRADRVGCCNDASNLTPVLDAIAAEGAVFTKCITQAPWTQPAVASLFTSQYPSVHRVLAYDRLHRDKYNPKTAKLNASITTMAEAMKEAGFETGAVLANPFIRDKYGFAQGFDHFEEILVEQYARGERINQAALKWLRNRTGDRPFFLYLHYMDVHGPYNAPKAVMDPLISAVGNMPNKQPMDQEGMDNLRYLLKQADYYGQENRDRRLIQYPEYWRARYDAGVRDMDNQIGALKKQLQTMGLWDEAYVIVTSDHGEQLYEHGDWDHGRTVHDYEVRVPLILRWPKHIDRNLRIGSTVQLIDVFPTLVAQLEISLPGGVQGRSLVPLLDKDPDWKPMPAFAEDVKVGHEQQAVYWGDWKLIHTPVEKADAFYDHRGSLSERTPATSIDDAMKAEMRKLRTQWVEENKELGNLIEDEAVPLTPSEQRRLENIGYTGGEPSRSKNK